MRVGTPHPCLGDHRLHAGGRWFDHPRPSSTRSPWGKWSVARPAAPALRPVDHLSRRARSAAPPHGGAQLSLHLRVVAPGTGTGLNVVVVFPEVAVVKG